MSEEKQKIEENVVLIGDKPIYAYHKAIQTIVGKGLEVVIKTRGKFISKAVNIAEIAKRNLNLKESEIKIGSQSFKTPEGKDITVSTFEVKLREVK